MKRWRLRRPQNGLELAAVIAVAALVPVLALLYSAAQAGSSAEPSPARLAATLTPTPPPAVAVVTTPAPATPVRALPYIPAHAEIGEAAAEPPPPPSRVATAPPPSRVATAAPPSRAATPAVPLVVDTSGFPPPPARTAPPPPNAAGIARMVAPALQIDHYVETVGIENNQMQTPKDATYAIGWYEDYARPGSGGNVIVSAHETWNHMQGPFFGLHEAQSGDEIVIEMADGRRYRYAVFSNVRYSVDDMPMAEIIWPTKRPRGEEWLTLITCGGRIVYDERGFGDYLDRDVVIARRVS